MDGFLNRICVALDMRPKDLAKRIGVKFSDIELLLGYERSDLVEMDRDETWFLIQDYVNKKLGSLMAIRAEMEAALQKDKVARVLRVERAKALDAKSIRRRTS